MKIQRKLFHLWEEKGIHSLVLHHGDLQEKIASVCHSNIKCNSAVVLGVVGSETVTMIIRTNKKETFTEGIVMREVVTAEAVAEVSGSRLDVALEKGSDLQVVETDDQMNTILRILKS